MAVPRQTRQLIMSIRTQDAEHDEPLHEEQRDIQMTRGSPQLNLSAYGRDTLDLEHGMAMRVKIFPNGIWIEPCGGE